MILNELTSVPSSAIPVTAFSEHLNLGSGFSDSGDQDSILETYLRAALAAIEARLGIALFRRRFSWGLYAWSNPNTQRLPVSPVQTIEALRVITSVGTETLVPDDNYRHLKNGNSDQLVATGACLPHLPHNGSVEIVFEAGYGASWDAIPADLRQAVLKLAAQHYEDRTGHSAGQFPTGVLTLLEPYRVHRLSGGGA